MYRALPSAPRHFPVNPLCRFGRIQSLAAIGLAVATSLSAQPIYTSNATIDSSVSLAEDVSITNSATVGVVPGGHLSVGANEVFVGGTEFAAGTGILALSGSGDLSNRTGYIGFYPGSTGTATVSGAGSTWTNTASLMVGRDGSGSLAITNAGVVTSLAGIIGYGAGSSGQVTLAGNGSAWNSSNAVFVGRAGTGTLTVEAGSSGTSSSLDLGSQPTGHGTVTLQGSGTSWTTQSANIAAGALVVRQGAALSSSSLPASIGSRAGSAATATVSGTGSTWTAHNVYVGSNGEGRLTIEQGGKVSSAFGFVGIFAGSQGDVTVTGPGSTWSNPTELAIAYEGAGSVTVGDGGLLEFSADESSILLADQAAGVGTLNIGAASSDPAAPAGIVGAATVQAGAGVGVLQFNTTGSSVSPTYFTRDGTSSGTGVNTSASLRLVHTAGHTVFTGDLAHTGPTNIDGGAFILEGDSGASLVTVAAGATLDGTGTLNGHAALASGAHLGSDFTLGTLTFVNGLSVADGAILNVELGTNGDLFRVSGGTLSAALGGTVTLNLTDAGGFTAGTYTFLDATGANFDSIGATSFEIGTFVGGYTYQVIRIGDLFQIVASAIPEPSAWASFLGLGSLALTAMRRRTRRQS